MLAEDDHDKPDLSHKKYKVPFRTYIVQIQRLGYEKIAGEIQSCHENALAKSFEMSPHMT